MSSIRIVRIASPEPLAQLAGLAASAWLEDSAYAYMNPHRHDYPEDWRELWRHTLLGEYTRPGKVMLAAVDEAGQMVGLAVWERVGTSHVARSWQGSCTSKRMIYWKQYGELFWRWLRGRKLRTIDFQRLREMLAKANAIQQQHPAEHWRLELVGVAPGSQRRGIGARLVQWGLDRCDEEGVVAVLEATEAGQALYERMGFERRGWMAFDEERQREAVMVRRPGHLG